MARAARAIMTSTKRAMEWKRVKAKAMKRAMACKRGDVKGGKSNGKSNKGDGQQREQGWQKGIQTRSAKGPNAMPQLSWLLPLPVWCKPGWAKNS